MKYSIYYKDKFIKSVDAEELRTDATGIISLWNNDGVCVTKLGENYIPILQK